MAANMPLNGLKVLVTRPEQQGKNLCEMIVASGGYSISFPVIEIVPIAPEHWASPVNSGKTQGQITSSPCLDSHSCGDNLDDEKFTLTEQDMIIFVSRNAVSYFLDTIQQDIPEHIQLVSVGAGSAASMRSHGLRVDIQPDQSIGSEGLLIMPQFEDFAGKQVLIVRGKGGRELLANTLVERGAKVRYIEVYERLIPSPSISQCEEALTSDCVVCTSVEGVKNLSKLLQKGLKTLLDKPMLVVSDRIKMYAESLGFQRVVVSADVSDEAILEQLIKLEI